MQPKGLDKTYKNTMCFDDSYQNTIKNIMIFMFFIHKLLNIMFLMVSIPKPEVNFGHNCVTTKPELKDMQWYKETLQQN